jgi:hypothetical protein
MTVASGRQDMLNRKARKLLGAISLSLLATQPIAAQDGEGSGLFDLLANWCQSLLEIWEESEAPETEGGQVLSPDGSEAGGFFPPSG